MSTVLVIDDIDFTRETITTILTRNGFEVFQAANGQDGIDEFNRKDPDLVLTDILMPEMEGLETIKTIKRAKPETPVIAITGSTNSPFLQIALQFGATTGIFKPFKQDELLDVVSKYIKK